jgi:hypothetical protein
VEVKFGNGISSTYTIHQSPFFTSNFQFRIAVPILGHEFPPKVRRPANENQIPFLW